MGKYFKMADVFTDSIKKGTNFLCGKTLVAKFVDGVECEYAVHAINSHDELVENMQNHKQEAERWEVRATKEASRVQDLEAEVDRLRRQLHFCEASRWHLIDQVNKMKRDVFEGKYQQKPYL